MIYLESEVALHKFWAEQRGTIGHKGKVTRVGLAEGSLQEHVERLLEEEIRIIKAEQRERESWISALQWALKRSECEFGPHGTKSGVKRMCH
jgi:hypothetical protein